MFLNVIEETPYEKRFLFGNSKPSSGMALAMFDLTMAGYGDKETCSQVGHKYRLSFKSVQYKTLRIERKLTGLYFEVVSRSILWIM